MAKRQHLDVDPKALRLPATRISGADPVKLHRQIARHGKSTAGMPRLLVYRCSDGELQVYDGVTRATRVAKLLPGVTVPVEVMSDVPWAGAQFPTVGEKLP